MEHVVVPALLLRRLPSERVATLRVVAPALVPLRPSVMAVQDALSAAKSKPASFLVAGMTTMKTMGLRPEGIHVGRHMTMTPVVRRLPLRGSRRERATANPFRSQCCWRRLQGVTEAYQPPSASPYHWARA